MGKHNKQRKRQIKYHTLNLRVNDVEWQFLQTLKENGHSMSEYLRTTMKTTPRYQQFIKVLYGNRLDEHKKSLPMANTKPSLPSDNWNSVRLDQYAIREAYGTTGVHAFDDNFTGFSDVYGSFKSDAPERDADKYTGEPAQCPVCSGEGNVDGEYCRRCRGRGIVKSNSTYGVEGTTDTGNGVGHHIVKEKTKDKKDKGILDILSSSLSSANGKIDPRYE